jgi:hypothetical protein
VPSLAPDAELGLYRNCVWTMKREFRLKRRNNNMSLFLLSRGVKDYRKILLRKKNETSQRFNGCDGSCAA